MACRRIALATADRSRLVADVATALRNGRLCVLPTETVYGLAILPSSTRGLDAARALKGRAAEHEFTWHLAAAADADALGVFDDVRLQRLRTRYWPGPLTLVVPGRDRAAIGLRVPAHDFTRSAIAAVREPLWLTSVNRTGSPPISDPAEIERTFGRELEIVVDDGKSPLGTASTVVRCVGKDLEVLREGILGADDVRRTAAELVLFVCTGNTCRSPLAEAFARTTIAAALQVGPQDVLARGLWFASAGTGTMDGMPASDGSLAIAKERGVDLSTHRSTELTPELCRRAARIFCLSGSHHNAVLELAPEVADRTSLLRADNHGIADPYGGSLHAYRQAATEIQQALQGRTEELLQLLPAAAR